MILPPGGDGVTTRCSETSVEVEVLFVRDAATVQWIVCIGKVFLS